jgi:hypothetical protein
VEKAFGLDERSHDEDGKTLDNFLAIQAFATAAH